MSPIKPACILSLFFLTGTGAWSPLLQSAESPGGDGMYRISVPLRDGETDEMYIYAVSPPGGDNLPVVVYGHGINHEMANCAPEAGPGGPDSCAGPTG